MGNRIGGGGRGEEMRGKRGGEMWATYCCISGYRSMILGWATPA